jgi:integrase
MASFERRGRVWRAQVKRNGCRVSASFPTKREAEVWAAEQERDMRQGASGAIPNKTLGDLLDKYGAEVSPKKRGELWELKRIKVLQEYKIAKVKLANLDSTHVAKWRDDRLKDVSGSSVCRDWNLLSHACFIAIREWKWLTRNPFREVTRPAVAQPREKVYLDDEIERICWSLGVDVALPVDGAANISQRVGYAFLFAIETAMRAGEIVGISGADISGNYVHLPKTKNGSPRNVPLSLRAREIIAQFPDGFGLTGSQIDALFRRARDAAGVVGRFHDSRRTALTRLAKIYQNPMDLAKVSGHRDLKILLNTYYQPSIDDLAEKLTQGNTSTPPTQK